MIKFQKTFSLFAVLGSLLLLSGCHAAVLNPKGPIAIQELHLLIDAVLLMSIIVVPVLILTFVIAHRYRASNTKAKYTPNWAHGTLLEAGWWILPCAIILVLATMTWRTSHELDPYKPLVTDTGAQPLTIEVIALPWRWMFIYPEQNIATMDFVEFPVNTPINLVITGDAPMNAFHIPQLAGQIYAMAGMQTKLHLLADETGDYNGRSTNFSGPGFTNMTFIARVSSAADFDTWVASVKQGSTVLDQSTYDKLAAPNEEHQVQYFASVSGDIFKGVIMKYMMPANSMPAIANMGPQPQPVVINEN